ncbi:integrase catalytic domain-containing protein [Trichonephila clavipes]|nr:integrase catalytic domain-containing protein [Trichonephila clavipes]
MPVTLPEKPDALEYAARQGQLRACIIYQEPNTKSVFVLFCKDNWYKKKTLVDNFKRAIMEAKLVNEFSPDGVLWEKMSKGLLRNPDRPLKNTDKRMVYIYNNVFFVKKDFTFGFRTVKSGEIHLIQTINFPMLIYKFPSSSLRCRANPNLFRRSFEPFDQMLYPRMVLDPHMVYMNPAGTRYILLTVQKTVFAYKLPRPTPAHVPAETNKRPLEEQPGSSSKRNRVFILQVIGPPVAAVLIARPSTALATPQPVIIPEPPVLTTPQILLPDPLRPPELTTPLVQIPDPPVQILPERTTPFVQIPDPPLQIPVLQPPMQIPPLPTTPPVQLFLPDPPPMQIL